MYIWAIFVTILISIILSILLVTANKYLFVEEDDLEEEILSLLPGINCGACSYPGCRGLAKAMAERKSTKATDCRVLRGEKCEKLQSYLDMINKR